MGRLNILRSRAVLTTLALAILMTGVWLFTPGASTHVPRMVAIRGELSKSEAESLYRSSNRVLRGLYWRRIRANLTAGHFGQFLLAVRRRPERIHTLSKEPDGSFVVGATNRLGESCTIRCAYPFVPQPSGPSRVQSVRSFGVVGRLNRSAPAQSDGAANESQPIRSETNGTSEAAGSRR
jgi:hypothetical protein